MLSKLKVLLRHVPPQEKRYLYAFGFLALFAFTGLTILTWEKLTTVVPIPGGTYTEGLVGQPIFINPVISGNNDADRDLIALTFCSLYDISSKIEPDQSGRNWSVRLKDNILWHNGEKLTSDDVIFTIDKIQDPEFKSPQSTPWQGITVNRVSELELSISLPTPFAFFPDNLKKFYPLPKHIFKDIPLANWRLSDYNLEPIGCGPFKFDSFKKRSDGFITKYSLVRNTDYFAGDAFIENFNINFYSDPSQAIEDFVFAKIDALGNLTKKQVDSIKRNHSLKALMTPRYLSVFINQASNPALKDKNVRLALSTAIDRHLLIRETLGGYADPLYGPLTPNFLNEEAAILNEPSDLNLNPNDILDSAGWKINEETDLREKIGQTKMTLEFTLLVPEVENLVLTANQIIESWNNLNVKTNITILPPDKINSDIIPDRDFELLLFGNIIGRSPDLFSFWHSSEKFYPGLNLSLYSNKTADRLIESIRQTFDREKRQSDLISLQTLIMRDYPAIFLNSPNYLYVTPSDLGGFEEKLIITPANRFDDVAGWYLKTARKLK